MYIKAFNYTNARKSSRWRNLFDAPRIDYTHHFDNSDSGWHEALYLDRPWHQPYTDTIYWAEEVNVGPGEDETPERGCHVYKHTRERGVEKITDEPYESRAEAVASAMFLAAV